MNEPFTTPPKSLFKSRSAWAGAVTTAAGAAGTFWPNASPWIAAHAATLLLVAGILQVILRTVTHGRVVLFPDTDSL